MLNLNFFSSKLLDRCTTTVLTGTLPTTSSGAGDLLLYLSCVKKLRVLFVPCPSVEAYSFAALKLFKSLCLFRYQEAIAISYSLSLGVFFLLFPRLLSYSHSILLVSYNLLNPRIYPFLPPGTSVYHLDSSFFCFKGYNWHHSSPLKPCFACLDYVHYKSPQLYRTIAECLDKSSSNINNSIAKNIGFLNENVSIHYVQTDGQKSLLSQLLLSSSTAISVTGMLSYSAHSFLNPSSILRDLPDEFLCSTAKIITIDGFDLDRRTNEYIVLCHAALSGPKGFPYISYLASANPQILFIYPLQSRIKAPLDSPNNIKYVRSSWSTNLRDLLMITDLTIIPSVWSSPIEASLLKSLWYAPNVSFLSISTKRQVANEFQKLVDFIIDSPDMALQPHISNLKSTISIQMSSQKLVKRRKLMLDVVSKFSFPI